MKRNEFAAEAKMIPVLTLVLSLLQFPLYKQIGTGRVLCCELSFSVLGWHVVGHNHLYILLIQWLE